MVDSGFKKRDRGLDYHSSLGEGPGAAQAPEAPRMRRPVEANSANSDNEIGSVNLIDRS